MKLPWAKNQSAYRHASAQECMMVDMLMRRRYGILYPLVEARILQLARIYGPSGSETPLQYTERLAEMAVS